MFKFTFHKTILLIALHLLLSNRLSAQWIRADVFGPLNKGIHQEDKDSISELSPLLTLTIKEIASSFLTPIVLPPIIERVKESPKVQTDIAEKPFDEDMFDNSNCIDLAFDSVSIVKIEEKYIEIEYSIVNKGTSPAPLFGTKRSVTDNVAVHFYFSGTPRLNRGSILADGIYLTEGLRETKGMLAPQAVYKNRFKLSLEKKSRFYGVIILQLDAFDILRRECDETNNNFSIVPKWY